MYFAGNIDVFLIELKYKSQQSVRIYVVSDSVDSLEKYIKYHNEENIQVKIIGKCWKHGARLVLSKEFLETLKKKEYDIYYENDGTR